MKIRAEIKVMATAFKIHSVAEFALIGKRTKNRTITAAAEKAGAQWLVVEQDSPSQGRTQMEAIRCSREYLTTIGY